MNLEMNQERNDASWLGALTVAVAFLTRIPVPSARASASDLARAAGFFPLVGLLLGVLLVVPGWLALGHLSPFVLAGLLLALLALATGGLHLDGVADLCDGLGAQGADAERRLAIMRDSHVGALGAVGVALLVSVKLAALAAILAGGPLATLVVFPVVGRMAAVLLLVIFPYARRHGLGTAFHGGVGATEIVVAGVTTLAALLWAGDAIVAAVVALLAALCLGAMASRRLGGVTGDVYGAAIELAETCFLVAMGWHSA